MTVRTLLANPKNPVALYRDPVVAMNTSQSDFRIRDLMHHEHPVSLYLVVRPGDADRLRPLIRLVLTQLVRRLTETMRFEAGRSVADYGLKAYPIMQDLQQIHSAYGRDEGLIGNCHLRIAYAPNKLETAELLSRMAGQTTVIKQQVTISGPRAAGGSAANPCKRSNAHSSPPTR